MTDAARAPAPRDGVMAGRAIERGVAALRRAQHPSGSWTDFWLPVGTSDAWVTAYVGLALHAVSTGAAVAPATRSAARQSARRAGDWLLTHASPQGGWGYNASVPVDADSTAHALSLLARLGLPIPGTAVKLLQACHVEGSGFRTYPWAGQAHAWARPCADVTAAALRALHDLGELTDQDYALAWTALLGPEQAPDGQWNGYWWTAPSYATGLALETWSAAGRPPLPYRVAPLPAPAPAFDLAWHVIAQAAAGQTTEADVAAGQLLGDQAANGTWPGGPILHVPPGRPGGGRHTLMAVDARRLMSTASAVRALALTGAGAGAPQRRRCAHTDRCRVQLTSVVRRGAVAAGLSPRQVADAEHLFRQLTRHSLRSPAPWPSWQLTALSGGMPLEFSAVVGRDQPPALRYATEVGDPSLPPPARLHSGLTVLEGVADGLGYRHGWERLSPAIALMAAGMAGAPDGTRFTVWGGIDHRADLPGTPAPPPVVKLYLNILHHELGCGRWRVQAALDAAGIPLHPALLTALDLLDGAGYAQELGLALGGGHRIACKVYYELPGWNRRLVTELLRVTGFGATAEELTPEIPGVIREGLAARSRAGIGLRVDPVTGEVREVMAASAFPPPLLPLADTARHVEAWLAGLGDPAPYRALSRVLRPGWPDQDVQTRSLHSLYTRTVTAGSPHTTVYLRPAPTAHPEALLGAGTGLEQARGRDDVHAQ